MPEANSKKIGKAESKKNANSKTEKTRSIKTKSSMNSEIKSSSKDKIKPKLVKRRTSENMISTRATKDVKDGIVKDNSKTSEEKIIVSDKKSISNGSAKTLTESVKTPPVRRSYASIKTVGTNTDIDFLTFTRQSTSVSIETSTVATSTEDLQKENTTKKILVMPNSSSKSTSFWHNSISSVIRNGVIPPTPDGTKFQQHGTQLTYTHPGVQNDTLSNLHGLQMRGEMCDVLIRVESVDFRAHKIVLTAACPYFANLFKEIKTIRIDRLILEGLAPQSVAAMIGYFYLAKLIIDADDVEQLLEAAYYFQTTEVVKICADYLELNLGIYNCFQYYILSQIHNIEGLQLKAFRYICWNFKSIVKEQHFYEISADFLIQIISSNQVKVKTEEEVYQAVWEWYRYNTEERKSSIPQLVIHIHFEVMELTFLEDKVKKEMYLEDELCKTKVSDAVNLITNKIDEENRRLGNYRQASDNIYIYTASSTICQIIDLVSCKLENASELQLTTTCVDQDYHVTIRAGKNLYTLSKTKVVIYNSTSLCWELFSAGVTINDAAICNSKRSIFVSGGKPNGRQLLELNLATKQWARLPYMEMDRRSPASGCMGNAKPRIYVVGGFSLSQNAVLNTIECYVTHTRKWSTIKEKMNIPRLQSSLIVQSEKLYIVGGRSMEETLNTVEEFDRTKQTCELIDGTLSELKTESCLVNFEGKIYCIGGKGCCTIERLDISGKVKTWTVVGNLDRPKFGMQCVVYQPV